MARRKQEGNRFFRLDVDFFSDKKIKILKARYGADGITLYMYLLCEIYKSGYYLKIDDDFEFIVSDDLNMDSNKVKQVLNFLLERSLFDNTLFQSDKVLTSAGIQRRYQANDDEGCCVMGIKVTRDMLDRYRKLKQEIPVLELELLMMKNTEAGLGNDTIFDYQTGYPRPQSVVGFDQKKYDRREKVLERKKEKVKAMDQWIDDIKDGQTRCVFRMFYKQGMTWKAIAKQIGMPHNEDYPRLMIRDKYLKNQGIK